MALVREIPDRDLDSRLPQMSTDRGRTDEGSHFPVRSSKTACYPFSERRISTDHNDGHTGKLEGGSRKTEASTDFDYCHRRAFDPTFYGTFTLAVLAIIAGVAANLGYVSALAEYDFWLVTGGAALLVIGVIFRRL